VPRPVVVAMSGQRGPRPNNWNDWNNWNNNNRGPPARSSQNFNTQGVPANVRPGWPAHPGDNHGFSGWPNAMGYGQQQTPQIPVNTSSWGLPAFNAPMTNNLPSMPYGGFDMNLAQMMTIQQPFFMNQGPFQPMPVQMPMPMVMPMMMATSDGAAASFQHHPNDMSGKPRFAEGNQQRPSGKPPKKAKNPAKKGPKSWKGQSEIVPPSAASGGIPEPTPEYMSNALRVPTTSDAQRPLLIVIDLNGTVLFRPNRLQPTKFVARPHAIEFMRYCIDNFHVVVWSSARSDNVRAMVRNANLLGPDLREKLLACWSRVDFGLTEEDFYKRVQCYKRLTKLWGDAIIQGKYPMSDGGGGGGRWDQSNTVLVDDSIEKARSEPYNCITLPEFQGNMDEEPTVLPMVQEYLRQLSWQEDVSRLIRVAPFKMGL
jgi:hypothetical protein